MNDIVLIVHNVRSAHNVGSLLRTCDGLGISKVFLSGITPYPVAPSDERLPHIATKVNRQIVKTSLGAEKTVDWEHVADSGPLVMRLKAEGYAVAALEQTAGSIRLDEYQPAGKIAVMVGNEVEGLDAPALELVDLSLEIPMRGQKESFNVAVAAAIALHYLALRLDKYS